MATGYQDSVLFSDYWMIDRWYHVNPGKCSNVSSRNLPFGDALGRSLATEDHLHLAFAFTDSSGVWGAGKDPSAGCGGAGTFLIPASIGYAAVPDYDSGLGDPYPTTFNLGFGPKERAIPVGSGPPQTSRDGGTNEPNGGDTSFLAMLMKEIAKDGAEASKKPLSPAEEMKRKAQAHASMLGWVREDVAAYLAASKSGFAAYKEGPGQVQGGLRMWCSTVKPAFAQGCWVVQGDGQATFSCLLYDRQGLNTVNGAYTELTDDMAQSLPRDWTPLPGPAFGPEFPNSKGYRSSSGAHGEVWVARTEPGGTYELHFQIVSAPGAATNSSAVTPKDDDPIGDGGFIRPRQ